MADAASEQSGSRGGSSATGVSQDTGHKKERRTGADPQNGDILEEKKSTEEALHASMYALVKEKGAEPWQYSYTKIVLEGLVAILIVFNTERPHWLIDESNWLWKLVRWAIIRSPIENLWGYKVYCQIFFALVVIVYTVLAGVAFLAWSMRKSEQSSWLKTLALCLQVSSDLLFSVLYMSILDYFMFLFACDFSNSPIMHHYFPDVQCLAMPHLAYLVVAGVTAVIFTVASVAVQTAGCDLNPTAQGLLASPAAMMKIKVVFAKAVFVTAANVFTFIPKPQSLLMAVTCLYVLWLDFKTVPFVHNTVNYIWCGMWTSVVYVTCLYATLSFSPQRDDIQFRDDMTMAVLYGVWPVLVGGGLITWWFHWFRMRAVKKFLDPNVDRSKLKKIHRFSNTDEVTIFCRAMRKFDLDGVIDPDAADLGELIIKAGLATFPNNPQLLILLANFLMEVRKDGPASRTQLQLVAKHSPNFVERYQVFCTIENSKRLKESNDQGMDLHSYVEFKRNFRAVMRLHKDALMSVREMWNTMLKSDPNMARLDGAVRETDGAIERAYRIYRKVVERYPKNGKLLRVYGSFLEDVKNDFKSAQRVYAQAMRQGGTANALLSMDFDFASQPGKPDMLLSMDINEDAIVLINAEGMIMMVSSGVTTMFGYTKVELEGENVAMLMPPPFNQRHSGYLQHYKDTGEARILDSVKEVVALHKDRHVFPVAICVTKLSGLGADAVFLGMVRTLAFSKRDVRAWLTPSGNITCCGQMFSAVTGILPDDTVGSNIKSIMAEQEAFDVLLQRAGLASAEEFESHSLAMDITILNKYIGHVPCHVYFTMGGTVQTRVLVLHITRKDEADDNLLVVDEQGQITFATNDLAVTLGYSIKDFLKLNLKQLLPAPTNAMHEKWLRDSPPSYPITSCRAGAIVNLLGSTNQQVPVRIQLSQHEEATGLKHVTRIWKANPNEMLDDRRVQITAGHDGKIVAVEPQNNIFGFPSVLLKGMNVCDVIDVFSDWKQKSGSGDMQLLMLALLDKEQEMPGAAWRIKVTPPESADSKAQAAKAVHHGHANTRHLPKSAIMQANLVEVAQAGKQGTSAEDGGYHSDKPQVRLTLWRRELLVGSLELDTRLRVRRADAFTGLIVGKPPSSLLKQPISKLLTIPRHSNWEELMGIKGTRKNALKTAPTMGKVSPPRMFEGHHPDGGSLRVILQGVVVTEALTGKSRIEVSLKPDMTFMAAHSDIWGALGLNCFGEEADERSSRSSSRSGSSAGEKSQRIPRQESKPKQRVQMRDALEIMPPGAGEDEAQQPKESTSTAGGDFVKRWVQTMDANRPSLGQANKQTRLVAADVFGAEDEAKPSKQEDWLKIAASMPDEAFAMPKPPKHHHHHQQRESRPPSGDNASESDFSDGAASSQNEDQRSAYSSKIEAGHEDEILVDSRRGKALRKLLLLLNQPGMTTPIAHVKWRTVMVLATLLLVRITFYITTVFLMQEETVFINQVHKTAGAADRSQVATGRVAVAVYCRDRLDLIAGDNICATLANRNVAISKLQQNIEDIEQYSQDVYLGHEGKVAKIHDPDTYKAWSNPDVPFTVYVDSNPPAYLNETRSLWELSNRFVSASRVMLWRIQYQNVSNIRRSRGYNYITLNGLDAVFNGYTRALDSLMVFAWKQMSQIKGDLIVLMVLETFVLVPLMVFWQWTLIRKAENVRTLHWLLMVALPSPVLRTLSSKPVKISEDSDADSDEDSDAGGGNDAPRKAGGSEGGDLKPMPSAQSLPAPVATKSTADMDRPFLLGQQASTDAAMPVARPKEKTSKAIKFSAKYFLLFLVPLALWFVALIAVYSISLTDVDGLQGPLAALNMAMHVIYRFSHVRALAFFAMSQSDPLERQAYRLRMVDAVKALTSEYDALLYGGMASTQAQDRFQQSVPAAAFILPAFADMFFKATNCMRADQSTCYDVNSPWYEATHHGLDSMMQRIITEMTLMTKDADTDLNIFNNTRYRTMYRVGIADLYDGLASAAQLFVDYSISRYKQVTELQVILLIVLVIMILLYVVFILRPYLALHRAELVKVAGFVSHVPQEVDVQAHVRRVLRHGLAPKHKKADEEHLEPVVYGTQSSKL